jgi:hypothetical protein
VPCAADAVRLLQDDVIGDAGLVELDRGSDTGEAGADDDHLMVESRCRHAIPLARGRP